MGTSASHFPMGFLSIAARSRVPSPTPPTGDYFYVATTGNDANPGTFTSPKLTIQAGVALLSDGDTLYIRSGTYTGSLNVIDSSLYSVASGSSFASPVTISAYPSETVTLQPPDGQQAIRLTTGSPHYIIIPDLILDGINQTLVPNMGGPELVYLSTSAHHNRFQGLEVKNNSGNGFQISNNDGSADYNEILDCIIHDNGRLNDTNTGYGIYLKANYTLIQGNQIYSNNGYGIHHNPGAAGGDYNIIVANILHDNAVHGVNTGNGTTSHAILIAKGTGNLIYNNQVYENQAGISVYSNSLDAGVYNNTVVDNINEGISLQYYGNAPTIQNNISYGNGTDIIDYGGTGTPVIDYNLTASDPLFVNGAAFNYHLTSPSPARDAGTTIAVVTTDFDGVSRPQGSAYCIGAFEFV
jgi:hypothetical protein